MPFAATQMDLEIVIQSEVSQKERDKYRIISLICGIQKNGTYKLICKAETESQTLENNLMVTKGRRRDGMNWEIGIDIYTLLYIKQISIDKDLLYSTGNSTQWSVLAYTEKESEKNGQMYMY